MKNLEFDFWKQWKRFAKGAKRSIQSTDKSLIICKQVYIGENAIISKTTGVIMLNSRLTIVSMLVISIDSSS